VTVFAVKVPNIPAADYFAPLSRSSSNFNEWFSMMKKKK
jgi:hypothetical protein